MSKILAFDQAANITGWSLWEDGKPIKWGIITPQPKNLKEGKRLSSLRTQFSTVIHESGASTVLLEDPVGSQENSYKRPENNWKTVQILSQVQGVLLQLIDEYNKKAVIVSPSTWQNTCGIHKRDRESRKAGAVEFIKKTYNINAEQDVIDSLCIAHHYLTKEKYERSAF